MGVSAPVASACHQVAADLLTGTPKAQTVERIASALQAGVKQDAVPVVETIAAAAATSKAVAAAETAAEKVGVLAKSEVAKSVEAIPAAKAELEKVRASLSKWTRLPSASAAREWAAVLAEDSASTVVVAALKDVEKQLPGLEGKVMGLWRNLTGTPDAEELAAAIASQGVKQSVLTAAEAAGFVRAVHDRLCDTLFSQLESLIKSPEMVAEMRAALADLRAQSKAAPELMPLFRERVRAIVAARADGVLAELVNRITDPVVRREFLDRLFDGICEKYAKAVIAGNFDSQGKRRILTALASFRKDYTTVGRAKAMENLIGWMYEATREVSEAVRGNAETFRSRLASLLSGKYQDLGLVVGEEVTMHFEVNAPSLGGGSLRQATDVMATVALSVGQGKGQRTVHVLATALESKGERGVLSGLKQVVERLVQRFRKGAPVQTERMHFTMGKDLFLTVEDAIRALKSDANTATARSIAVEARAGADRYRAYVVSPLAEDVAKQLYAGSFGPEGNPEGKVVYLAHSISRDTMLKVVQGMASVFGL